MDLLGGVMARPEGSHSLELVFEWELAVRELPLWALCACIYLRSSLPLLSPFSSVITSSLLFHLLLHSHPPIISLPPRKKNKCASLATCW